MSQPHPELLILVITIIGLALAPLASKLVRDVGDQISGELDGGRTGDALRTHLDESYEGSMQDDEVKQLLDARAFRHGEAEAAPLPPPVDDGLEDEVRQLVIAANGRRERAGEPALDVEAEVARRLAALG